MTNFSIHPLPLPNSEVGVLNWKLRKWYWIPLEKGFVDDRQLSHKNPDRPAVEGDMMHIKQQHVFVVRQRHQRRSHQRSLGKIEWLRRVQRCQAREFALPGSFGKIFQIN